MRNNATTFGRLYVLLFTLALTSSCTTLRTFTDYDASADFSTYQTFAWIDDRPLIRPRGRTDEPVSALNLQRIKNAIENELTIKGFSQIGTRHAADFLISFTVGARDKIDVDAYPAPYGGPWGHHWPYYGDAVSVRTYTEGVLAIDIFDSTLRKPVWHGTARKQITASDRVDPEPKIQRAVAAIFADFPPKENLK